MKFVFLTFALFSLFFSNIHAANNLWYEFKEDHEIFIQALLAEDKDEEKSANQEKIYKIIRLRICNKNLDIFNGIVIRTSKNIRKSQIEEIDVDAVQPLYHKNVEKITIEDGYIEIVFKKEGDRDPYTKITITRLEEELPAKMIHPIHTCSVTLSEFWSDDRGAWNTSGYHKYEGDWRENKYHSIEKLILPSVSISSNIIHEWPYFN